jgi:raffinose/stachyose/melibiose transport system permease protein
VPVMTVLALAIALMLNAGVRGWRQYRAIVFLPYILPATAVGLTFSYLLQRNGVINTLLRDVGLGALAADWLGDAHWVVPSIGGVVIWQQLGFGVVIFTAALLALPQEVTEAALLDGATPWKATRYVTLPLLAPTIRIWIFLSVIGALQLFDLVWIMTLGGPAGASTTMATYLIDRGFRRYEFGYGSAVAVVLFAICFVFALLYQRFALRRDTAGAVTRMVGA